MKWRLILDSAASGAWNMAVDEALLCHARDEGDAGRPTLRFYDWQPACLSLGRFQKWEDVPANRAAAATADVTSHPSSPNPQPPFDIVRRPTGGRAVWHQHEITYCVVLREDDLPPDARSVAGAYGWLSAGLIAGLHTLGVHVAPALPEASAPPASAPPASAAAPSASNAASALAASASVVSPAAGARRQRPNCFESATRADLKVADGRKLIGAAQVRRGGVVLQHGSLLLEADETAWRAAIGGSLGAVTTLRELGVQAARHEIIAALCAGCEEALGARLAPGALSAPERATAEHLCEAKYQRAWWNVRAGHE